MSKQTKLTRFNDNVLAKYQVYNSVFMTLPFDDVSKIGTLLPYSIKLVLKVSTTEILQQKLLKVFSTNIYLKNQEM